VLLQDGRNDRRRDRAAGGLGGASALAAQIASRYFVAAVETHMAFEAAARIIKDMQLALASPLFRSIAVGTALLAASVGGFIAHHKCHTHHHLVLHTYSQRGAVYLTAWHNGAVLAPFEGEKLQPLTFTTIADVSDGCRWQGIETLEPIDGNRFAYRYDEKIIECEPGADPYVKTPRTGIVTLAR
jgi:hypothetical protein